MATLNKPTTPPATIKPTPSYAGKLVPAPITTQPVVSTMGSSIGQATMDNIRQKALSGQSMMAPTAEKQALYDYYKANPNAAVSGPISSATLGNIQQKSQLGQSMLTNTPEKQALYDYYQRTGINPSVKDTDTSGFTNNQNMYNNSVSQADQNYQNSQARQDATKWNNATIADIAAKYGFDYSRDYAKQQAEAEAQALRNANADAQRRNESNKKTGLADIDNNLMNQAEALDRNYFQQYMNQQQNQVGSGLNGGIASDQDLRLQMNRQAEMGASYRDANLGKMKINENFSLEDLRLAEAMGLINQQALAREDALYNERLQQGFGNLMTEREMANALDQQMWGRSESEKDRAMQLLGMNNSQEQWLQQFDYNKGRDLVGDNQWQTTFDYNAGRDKVADQQWSQQFNWNKLMDEAGLTGNYNGGRTLAGSQFDWSKQQDTIQNQQWEKQFNEDVRQFGLNYALQKQEAAARARSYSSGGGGGSSSGGSSGGSASKPAQNLAKQFQEFKTAANNQVDTVADRYYAPKVNWANNVAKTIAKNSQGPTRQAQKTLNNMTGLIRPISTIDRKLDLFRK